jgi:hypothetical protein
MGAGAKKKSVSDTFLCAHAVCEMIDSRLFDDATGAEISL